MCLIPIIPSDFTNCLSSIARWALFERCFGCWFVPCHFLIGAPGCSPWVLHAAQVTDTCDPRLGQDREAKTTSALFCFFTKGSVRLANEAVIHRFLLAWFAWGEFLQAELSSWPTDPCYLQIFTHISLSLRRTDYFHPLATMTKASFICYSSCADGGKPWGSTYQMDWEWTPCKFTGAIGNLDRGPSFRNKSPSKFGIPPKDLLLNIWSLQFFIITFKKERSSLSHTRTWQIWLFKKKKGGWKITKSVSNVSHTFCDYRKYTKGLKVDKFSFQCVSNPPWLAKIKYGAESWQSLFPVCALIYIWVSNPPWLDHDTSFWHTFGSWLLHLPLQAAISLWSAHYTQKIWLSSWKKEYSHQHNCQHF